MIQRLVNALRRALAPPVPPEEDAPYREYVAGEKTVFHPGSRIFNLCGGKERISIGSCCHIRGELTTFAHGGSISLGDYCYVGAGTRIWSAASITIGDRVLISHNVNIFDNDTHPIDDEVARHQQFVDIITTGHPRKLDLNESPIVIEDDALIACQSIILSGVRIGAASVVAAGSVVTRDVPPRVVVGGNPARVLRNLHPREDARRAAQAMEDSPE